jgi:protein-disulfide isomerase
MTEPGKNRRDRAAAARDAANADERRRERTVRIVGAITVIVVVIGIIGVAVYAKSSSSGSDASATATPTEDTSAALPSGVLPADDVRPYGVPVGTNTSAPVLELWEDFQCPACAALEAANGAGIEKLAEDGKIQLVWRPTTFLDRNLKNDSSLRAAAAWGCAIDAGKAQEFHNTVFTNQPAEEGAGYTDEELITFGEKAGITGADLTTYKACVADNTYVGWANNSAAAFYAANIQGTPFGMLDGVEVPTQILADEASLEKFLEQAATGASAVATPAASSSPAASPAAS